MNNLIDTVRPYINEYGYWAVLVGVMLEDFGVPLPGETMLIVGAVLASQGQLNIVLLLLTAWAGAVVGDNIGYAIGRFGGRRFILRYGHYVFIHQKRLEYVEYFFEKYGSGVVVLARFVEIFRQLNGLAAGIAKMEWWRFLLFNALGAGLWASFWGILVYKFGEQAKTLQDAFKSVGSLFVAGLVIGVGSFLVYWVWHHRQRNTN